MRGWANRVKTFTRVEKRQEQYILRRAGDGKQNPPHFFGGILGQLLCCLPWSSQGISTQKMSKEPLTEREP
jgi:hypothetical protein